MPSPAARAASTARRTAAFIRRGARVSIGDMDGDLVRTAAGELGAETLGLQLDVTDRSSFGEFLAETERQLGLVAVLVNDAGIMPLAALVDERDEIARRQVDINVHGVLLGMKLAVPGW